MRCLKVIMGLALAALAGGAAFVWLGLYDISATDQHLAPTYRVLDYAMRRSVKQRADDIAVPDLADKRLIARGLSLYRSHCVQCHGAPGVPPQPFALGMTPVPAALMYTAREWPPGQLFWVVREGIKMTGMPAWKYRLSDEDIWAVVAFLPAMAHLTPGQYAALEGPNLVPRVEVASTPPSVERGKRAIGQYGCVTCHHIPGIVGPNAPVGPPLASIGSRRVLGGVLANTPENMVRWLLDPQAFAGSTAMPDLGLSERDARDIAAYLGTLK